MVSKESVVCPYCNYHNGKTKALGDSGLINYSGSSKTCTCDKCSKDFYVEYEVKFRFKTSKMYENNG